MYVARFLFCFANPATQIGCMECFCNFIARNGAAVRIQLNVAVQIQLNVFCQNVAALQIQRLR